MIARKIELATRVAATSPRPMSPNQPATVRTGRRERPLPRPVEGRDADRDQHQGDRAGRLGDPGGRRRQQPPDAQDPLRGPRAREPREHAEVDRERLSPREPRLAAEEGHGDERVDRVRDRRDRRRVGREPDGLEAALAVDELEPGEGDDPERRRPAAEALGIAERGRRAGRPSAWKPPPTARAIARHGLKARKTSPKDTLSTKPEPGGDEDERDREVPVGCLRPLEPRVDRRPRARRRRAPRRTSAHG